MVVSITVNRGAATMNSGIIRYTAISGIFLLGTTEENVQIPVRTAGVFSRLAVYVSANSLVGGSCTVRLRNSLSPVNGSLSIGAGVAGQWFEDTTNTDSFADTDEVSVVINTTGASSGSITFQVMRIMFAPTGSECVTFLASRGSVSTTADDQIAYMTPGGYNNGLDTNEANRKLRIRIPCTSNHFCVKVAANARDTDTTYRTRKNGANGGQSVTAVAGVASFLEDTSGSDSLVAGDDYAFQQQTDDFFVVPNGSITIEMVCVQLVSTIGEFLIVASGSNGVLAGVTSYGPLGGRHLLNATEANVAFPSGVQVTVREFGALASSNSLNGTHGACTVRLRKNSSDTAQLFATGTADGLMTSGTANPITSDAGGDDFSYSFDASDSGAGSVLFQWTAAVCFTPKSLPPTRQHRRTFARRR